jgi:hypothetical protein
VGDACTPDGGDGSHVFIQCFIGTAASSMGW